MDQVVLEPEPSFRCLVLEPEPVIYVPAPQPYRQQATQELSNHNDQDALTHFFLCRLSLL